MATIKPFRALRPAEAFAKQVSCVPYDIVHGTEVRSFIKANPSSFLRVTRAEGDFPEGAEPSDAEIFERARQNLDRLIADGIYQTDSEDALYVYQLASNEHAQTGIVGCCSLDEYEQGIIKKHENVRPDKVEDRTEHLLAVGAQTGLIFLAFRGTDEIHRLIDEAVKGEPIYDYVCADGIRQRVWRITDTAPWTSSFGSVDALYIADGHHRVESANLARHKLRERDPGHGSDEDYNYVVAGVFPAEDLRILPYNRIVKDLNGLTKDEFFLHLNENFMIEETDEKVPESHGDICMYMDGQWYKLRSNLAYIRQPDPVEGLDVSILQDRLLSPILGITDPTTDTRIGFVGGARGTDELERSVDEGTAQVAFSLYPTTMDDMLIISDMNEIMPPKSTWFEPKLKDGLLVHKFET